jgi:hypothetical protein
MHNLGVKCIWSRCIPLAIENDAKLREAQQERDSYQQTHRHSLSTRCLKGGVKKGNQQEQHTGNRPNSRCDYNGRWRIQKHFCAPNDGKTPCLMHKQKTTGKQAQTKER